MGESGKCLSCRRGYYLDLGDGNYPTGSCIAKDSDPITTNIYVTTSGGDTQDGSYDHPFENLFDAIDKGYELSAGGTNSIINIFLFKGNHFILENGQKYTKTKSSETSLDTSVTIQYVINF